ncbi:glycosyltransferase family 2 protein [Myceligenerans pegani]|uniref:Glycosyltransferase family 2 protein n=1 Tax=Myceligenerans pegani TaxID=2776917 RepID=A0ABR9MUR2_9MICO|nr:glycosyltransferase family 2 protein [Myceligenerans sp. TRM 65318]MBE1874781.1 glycosyltransferase family 2 protein [Myceligenerans sp. TRM 65318]MBE3017052.1 glycosyltransferase family 2 protein [Myceligenerans sp. TRM 65318]
MTAPHATVAVLTYRRPERLATALEALLPHVSAAGAGLLVVDNDVTDSARPVVERVTAGRTPVRYVHEPTPGIAAARNRALDEVAASGSDLIVFVDDDETPAEGWLATLLAAHERYGGTGVAGPAVPSLPGRDRWIESGGFFTRPRYPSGTRIDVAASNNLLLDVRWLAERGLRFDEAFGLTGGSDTMLTLRITTRGGALYWCDEAVVEDPIPAKRFTRRWVVRRAYRVGNCTIRAEVQIAETAPGRLAARMRGLGAGVIRVTGGLARAAAGTIAGHGSARGIRTTARGAGMIAGAVGLVYTEYARAARSPRPVGVPS